MDLADARVVAVLTRAPSSGGKTRLFDALGLRPDPTLLTALLLDTLDGVNVQGVRQVVAVEPASRCGEVRALVSPTTLVIGQPDGSLGERMRRIISEILAAGARAVVLVGSDLPELQPTLVTDAFAALESDPGAIVLGPAADGGYYLIGACQVPEVFDRIAWGGAGVLAETVAAAERVGLRIRLLPPLSDVDTAPDIERIRRSTSGGAVRTRDWARTHAGGW